MDAYLSIGASAWLGSDQRSFALSQAVGSVGLVPSHTAPGFVALGNGATRRAVTNRQCNLNFDTLYWRPHDDDLFTWLEATAEIAFLVELVNGAAFFVQGPRSSFNVTAPTNDLIQVTGTIENGGPEDDGDDGYIALVGGRVATYPGLDAANFGGDPVAYANFDWGARQLYAVTVLDEFTAGGGAPAPAITAVVSNLREADGATARPNLDRTLFTGVERAAGVERGAGLQVANLTQDALGAADGQARRGTLTPALNAGMTAATGRTWIMQEMGVATRD